VAQEYVVEKLEKNEERIVFLGEKKGWVDGTWKEERMKVAEEAVLGS
jgi:presequence protease